MKKVFMFSGQGAQYVGMGKELYDNYEEVRKIFDFSDSILGYSLKDIMFNDEEKLSDTLYTQVAMFTLYASILEVLKINDIKADYNIGLSLGEYGALFNTKVFDFETGLKILQKRGQFMSESSTLVDGKMSAILGLETSVLEEIVNASKEYVKIANYNTYGQLVISGVESAVLNVNKLAIEAGAKRTILLNTSGPFHTELMADASLKFRDYLDGISLSEPKGNLLLNVSGDFYKENIKNSMVDQITSSVRFYQMIERLIDSGATTFIEIGPKKTLCSFVKKIDRKLDIYNVEDISTLENLLEFLKEE